MRDPAPTLRVRGVTKRFGAVVANDDVSFEAWPGEVHCLLGENGAGKSTLISMLAGLRLPDHGTLEIDGESRELASPAVSLAQGIGIVYQHSALIPTMTVIDNLVLAQAGFWLDNAKARGHLAELNDLLGTEIDPRALVGELGLGQQQQLEIARAMWAAPKLLVLDEPTSMLSRQGIEDLMRSIRRLTAHGVAVLLVTHKLDEAIALGDRVTVLREGRVVRRFRADELKRDGEDHGAALILDAMFGGAEMRPRMPTAEHRPESRGIDGAVLDALVIEGVSTARGSEGTPLEQVSLHLRRGEILGVAGIDGHGQRHLAEVIAGQRAPTEGSILFEGRDITAANVRARQRLGIRYVTDDRLREGVVGSFTVALNLLLKRIGERPFWRFGRMDRSKVLAHAEQLIEQYGIRASSPDVSAGTLSGGNIQKILIARELTDDPNVVVFNKPSYGLDVRTARLVHEQILRVADSGGSVLLISTDLDELVGLANRTVVLARGRIVARIENDGDRVRERIGEAIVGSASR